MGEKAYRVGRHVITFSDTQNDIGCLCTFPHNYQDSDFDAETLQSLAVFGAVVRLVLAGYYDDHEGEYIVIPDDVPAWILTQVREALGINESETK